MSNARPRIGVIAALVAGVLALAACSGGGGSNNGDHTEVSPSAAPITMTYAHEQEFTSYNNNTAAQAAVANAVVLNQVLVRVKPTAGDADAATKAALARVQDERICWLGGTRWHGMDAMRISVSNWSTKEDDIDRSACIQLGQPVLTLSGNGINGPMVNGVQATSATLNSPAGIAFDSSGNFSDSVTVSPSDTRKFYMLVAP